MEDSLPPPDPSVGRAIVTAEIANQAYQEREKAYIRLMDQMEADVDKQGQYFVKFGDKKQAPYGNRDTRALVLIQSAVDPKDGNNLFIAITREGPKGLRLVPQDKNPQDQDEQGEARMKRIIQSKLQGNPDDKSIDLGIGFRASQGSGKLAVNYLGDMLIFPNDDGSTEMRTVDLETVKIAITESQRAAEVPHFIKLQQEQQGLADANNLMDVISKLPPKQ